MIDIAGLRAKLAAANALTFGDAWIKAQGALSRDALNQLPALLDAYEAQAERIAALEGEVIALQREGEFICRKCGLRQDGPNQQKEPGF